MYLAFSVEVSERLYSSHTGNPLDCLSPQLADIIPVCPSLGTVYVPLVSFVQSSRTESIHRGHSEYPFTCQRTTISSEGSSIATESRSVLNFSCDPPQAVLDLPHKLSRSDPNLSRELSLSVLVSSCDTRSDSNLSGTFTGVSWHH